MFQNIGLGEIIIIAIVLMVLFGGQKFPELARGIAQAMKEFRTALNEDDDDESSPPKKTKKKV
jgi:sec-independent protein translocase protein TatA